MLPRKFLSHTKEWLHIMRVGCFSLPLSLLLGSFCFLFLFYLSSFLFGMSYSYLFHATFFFVRLLVAVSLISFGLFLSFFLHSFTVLVFSQEPRLSLSPHSLCAFLLFLLFFFLLLICILFFLYPSRAVLHVKSSNCLLPLHSSPRFCDPLPLSSHALAPPA